MTGKLHFATTRTSTTAAFVLLVTSVAGVVSASDKVDFARDIWPILESRCVKCHGGPYYTKRGRIRKAKADLRLDSAMAIKLGGKEGPPVVPGDPSESLLYTLTILPSDDADIMPQEGDPLTKDQTESIRKWIQQGADFGDWDPTNPAASIPLDDFDKIARETPPATDEALSELQKLGAKIRPLTPDRRLLCVDLSQPTASIRDAHLKALERAAPQIVSLNLAHSKISRNGIRALTSLKHLTCLHLGQTAIDDDGLAYLKQLKHLSYLNLYGTNLTDTAAAHIEAIVSLKTIVLWDTKIGDQASGSIQRAKRTLRIIRDQEPATKFDKIWCESH